MFISIHVFQQMGPFIYQYTRVSKTKQSAKIVTRKVLVLLLSLSVSCQHYEEERGYSGPQNGECNTLITK